MSIDLFALAWKVNFPGKPIKKLVLLSLADQANDRDHHCWPTYETIANRCGMSRRTAITTIAELEQEGFIRRVARYKVGGLHTSNAFWVNRAAMETAVAATHSEAASPLSETAAAPMVSDAHHDGAAGSPSMVIDVHPNGDPPAPRTLIQPPVEPSLEPPPATAPPAAPAAAAAADLRAAILDWIAFDDALTDKERTALDAASLLAWAYWVKLKQAEPHSGVYNPVGLVRAQWRSGKRPRADLLRLARGWLALDDDARGRLLGRLEWAGDFADPGYIGDLEEEFPNLPLSTAAAVYAATDGQLAPAALTPPQVPAYEPPPAPEISAPEPVSHPAQPLAGRPWPAWPDALEALEMSMTRATYTTWFGGSAATLDGDDLTIHVRNDHAVAWLRERLHPVVQRAVDYAAGRPLAIRYVAGLPLPEVAR